MQPELVPAGLPARLDLGRRRSARSGPGAPAVAAPRSTSSSSRPSSRAHRPTSVIDAFRSGDARAGVESGRGRTCADASPDPSSPLRCSCSPARSSRWRRATPRLRRRPRPPRVLGGPDRRRRPDANADRASRPPRRRRAPRRPRPHPEPDADPRRARRRRPRTRWSRPARGRAATGHEVGRSQPGQSRNWAGYVATRGATSFSCVEATWTQPKVRCRGTSTQSVVYWVGLGGYNQRSLVQVGTESTCQAGVRLNAAWHESLPRERYSIRTATSIRAGDRIWAQVRWLGGSRYRLSLANLTNRQHFSIRVTSTTLKRTTAEWVVEAPSGGCPSNCHPVKMPDFQTFRFRDAWVTTGGRRLPGRRVTVRRRRRDDGRLGGTDPGRGDVDGEHGDRVLRPLASAVGPCADGPPRRRTRRRWWSYGDSNPGPPACHAGALPAEL